MFLSKAFHKDIDLDYGLEMKALRFLALFLLSASPLPTFAYSLNMAECKELTNSLNQTLPSVVNEDTVLLSTHCSGNDKVLKFIYTYELTHIPEEKINKNNVKKMIKMFCSNPTNRFLLDAVSFVNFDYYKPDGAFWGKVNFSAKDCD